jgi:hypothetical protein
MSFSDAAENAIMLLLFNATAWAGMADNAAAAPQANIAVSLHTADPGESGTLLTNEVTYTGYGRVNVPRSNAGWVVTGNSASPAANVDFPAGTGGGGTITHFSAGKTGGGAAAIHMSGTVAPNVVAGNGVTPRLTTATTLTLD